MDTVFRLIGLLATLFTVAITAFMLLTFRKERKLGAVSPLVAMALSLIMLPIFMFLSGARLNLLLAAPIMAIGLVLGILRGQTTQLYYRDGHVTGRHSLFFLLGWGASLTLSQGVNLLGSALLASAALLPLFLSTGTQVGINANLFLRRLLMEPPPEAVPVDVAQQGLPERETLEAGPPETTPVSPGDTRRLLACATEGEAAMRCESCGAELALADVSCRQCGARVSRARMHPRFESVEREFFALRGRHASGLLTDEEYAAALNGLTIRDDEGRPWMLGAETGHWYYHDGGTWASGEPPEAEAPPPARRLSSWPLIAGIAAVLILLCLGTIPIVWLTAPKAISPPGSPQVASVSTRTPSGGPTRTLAPSPTPPATATQVPTTTPTGMPSLQGVVFASGVTGGSEPVGVTTEFPEGTTSVYAFASYAGMSSGAQCESVWYRAGEEQARTTFDWALGETGQTWIDRIQEGEGLLSGRYNWELHVVGEFSAGGVFTVGQLGAEIPPPPGTATRAPSTATPVPPTPTRGPTEFDPIIFAQGLTEEADPILPTSTFPPGTTEVYAVWACRGMYPGLELLAKWYHDGQEYTASNILWEQEGERGRWWLHLHRASGAPLPGGNYRLELYVHGQLLQSGAFTIQ